MKLDNLSRCAPVFESDRHREFGAFKRIRNCSKLVALGIIGRIRVAYLIGP